MRLIIPLLLCAAICAAEIPDWVLPGLLAVESSSYYDGNSIVYVDRSRGKDGERGPTQILPSTFRQYAKPGERFDQLELDMAFAERFTRRILLDLYERHQSWIIALSHYHRGKTTKSGKRYAHRVAAIGHGL